MEHRRADIRTVLHLGTRRFLLMNSAVYFFRTDDAARRLGSPTQKKRCTFFFQFRTSWSRTHPNYYPTLFSPFHNRSPTSSETSSRLVRRSDFGKSCRSLVRVRKLMTPVVSRRTVDCRRLKSFSRTIKSRVPRHVAMFDPP